MFQELVATLLPSRSGAGATDGPAPVRPATQARVHRMYRRPESFTDLLPWMEFDPGSQAFVLEDGVSVGALFELTPVGTEARPQAFMAELRDSLQNAITDAVTEEDDPSWIVQFYVQDEPQLQALHRQIEQHVDPRACGTEFTRDWLACLGRHFERISAPGGLFLDTAVTGGPWRGQIRRVRAALYRRLRRGTWLPGGLKPEDALNDVCVKWTSALQSAGIGVQRCDGKAFYEWMLPWFNPAPAVAGGDPAALLEVAPYPGDEDLPFGHDLAEALTLSMPRSEAETATWWFDGLPHRVVTVQGLRRNPDIGHMTAERRFGDRVVSLFDGLPAHTVLAMTLIVRPQDTVRNHVAAVKRAAVGDGAEAVITHEDAEAAELEMARGNKLYPLAMAFYLRAQNADELHRATHRLNAVLIANGLQPVAEESDLLALDSYIRNLPMAYDAGLDRISRRSRLVFSRAIANLLPLYGRSRGTGRPGLVFYNRGGEPLLFDPLNRADRRKNAHALILGPTGSGKSALLVYLLMQTMAVHRPRVFLIEAGNSFGLLGRHFADRGLSVVQLHLSPGADVSLPPFRDAVRVSEKGVAAQHLLDDGGPARDDEDDPDDARRDLLGEMEIAARIMITGGDVREDARMTRADRLVIRNAILKAAEHARGAGRDQALTEDVVRGLREIAADPELPENRRGRAAEMADGMALFCSGLAGRFFNRPGRGWGDADLTVVDMGILAREGYEDQLTVAYIGLMNYVNDLAERCQHDPRPTLVVTDEGHIITTNPLLAPYVVKITKMWRKLGTWLWIATQNLEDFPSASKKMLSMMEWWLCLATDKDEIEQIARFKELTEEQHALLLSARKEPGKYTEGVVLSDKLEALFRNVPPPLALALAQTEKHEKAERARIMKEQGCSELDAVYRIARNIEEGRR